MLLGIRITRGPGESTDSGSVGLGFAVGGHPTPRLGYTATPAGAALSQVLGDTGEDVHLKAGDGVCSWQLLLHQGGNFFLHFHTQEKNIIFKSGFPYSFSVFNCFQECKRNPTDYLATAIAH